MNSTGIKNIYHTPSGRGKPYIVRFERNGKAFSATAATIQEAIRIKWTFEEERPPRRKFGWDDSIPPQRRSGHGRWPSIVVVATLALAATAWAHESGSPYAEWMMAQKRPDLPTASCCGPADQYFVDSYQANPDGSFEAVVRGETIHVPQKRVKEDSAAGNPTGRGVIWMYIYRNMDGTIRQDDGGNGSATSRIYCFIPAIGT